MATPRTSNEDERRRALLEYLGELETDDPTPASVRRRAERRVQRIVGTSAERLDPLATAGDVRPPTNTGERQRPRRRIEAKGSVSELVAEQRR